MHTKTYTEYQLLHGNIFLHTVHAKKHSSYHSLQLLIIQYSEIFSLRHIVLQPSLFDKTQNIFMDVFHYITSLLQLSPYHDWRTAVCVLLGLFFAEIT